jgi:hypothetical protein
MKLSGKISIKSEVPDGKKESDNILVTIVLLCMILSADIEFFLYFIGFFYYGEYSKMSALLFIYLYFQGLFFSGMHNRLVVGNNLYHCQ